MNEYIFEANQAMIVQEKTPPIREATGYPIISFV